MTGQVEAVEVLGERERYLHGFLTGLAHLHPQPEAAAALVDELFALVTSARADGIEEGRGDMEHLERKWRAEARRECAAQLRVELDVPEVRLVRIAALVKRWSGSDRTPAAGGPS